jgi:hypothetical protein
MNDEVESYVKLYRKDIAISSYNSYYRREFSVSLVYADIFTMPQESTRKGL